MQIMRTFSFLVQSIFVLEVLTGCLDIGQVTKPSPMDNFYRANGWTRRTLAPRAVHDVASQLSDADF